MYLPCIIVCRRRYLQAADPRADSLFSRVPGRKLFMKIVILGAGAIGRLLAVFLGRGGHQVVLVDPDKAIVAALNSHGTGYMEPDSTDPDAVSYVPAIAETDSAGIDQCDLVLLAVKSFSAVAAVKAAQHLISVDSPVVTLQTGLGTVENLQQFIDRECIIGGFTFMSGTSLGAGIVRHGGAGKTYLGELDGQITDRLTAICTAFSESGLECTPVQRIMGRLWSKVIVFSAINAVTAVLQVKNGQLLDSVDSITLLKRLIDEGRRVAESQAIDLVFPDLYQVLFDGCNRSRHNLSSMLQDILEGKRTEVDAQCGALVRLGELAGIATPTHQTMLELIQLIGKQQHLGATRGFCRV